MRRFLSSKLMALGLPLLGVALTASTSFAQTTGAGASPAPVSHTGLISLIMQNKDMVFFTIVILSIIGLTFIIQGFIKTRAEVLMPEASTNHIRDLISQRQFKELIEYTESDPSFISKSLNPALKRAPSFSSMKEAMETAIGEQTAEQFRKIEYLNIIGNLGPLLGLLGTVLGMIAAFQAMNDAHGATDPSTLAGGISKALCHTFLGLFLAIPCLAAFGVLRTMVDRLTVRAALLSEELLLMIKPADAKPAAAPSAPGARAGALPPPPGARKAPPVPMPPPAM
jgi:biopolymer transport protein ExbB